MRGQGVTDDESFVAAIRANPADEVVRLVYADLLDDRGDPRAAYLRAEVAVNEYPDWEFTEVLPGYPGRPARHRADRDGRLRLARLRAAADDLPPDRLAAVGRGRVGNCDAGDECPKRWELLPGTADMAVRHCGACDHPVYFCTTEADVVARLAAGRRLACDLRLVWTDTVEPATDPDTGDDLPNHCRHCGDPVEGDATECAACVTSITDNAKAVAVLHSGPSHSEAAAARVAYYTCLVAMLSITSCGLLSWLRWLL